MKDTHHCRQTERAIFRSSAPLGRLMEVRSGRRRPSFGRINLDATNVGPVTILRQSGREAQDQCSINIYVNNHLQGVNNSILFGSDVRMRDPGVCLSFGELGLDGGPPEALREGVDSSRAALAAKLGFISGAFFFVCSSFFLLWKSFFSS